MDRIMRNYKQITKCINKDLEYFNVYLLNKIEDKNDSMSAILKDYINNKGKRIRPVLIFLLTNAFGIEPNKQIYELAFADEILHNATLIHDDIIDASVLRRETKTLNIEYDSKLAVIAGDYLLSLALNAIAELGSEKIIQIHTQCMSELIKGESEQYFSKFKITTIDEYIEKSRRKTAELFKAALNSVCILCGKQENLEQINNFAQNFGIAFQINNDILNLFNEQKICEDLNNGIYTAPFIFYSNVNKLNDNIDDIKSSTAIEQTEELINKYANSAIENIQFLEDNQYKQSLIDLCELYKTSIRG